MITLGRLFSSRLSRHVAGWPQISTAAWLPCAPQCLVSWLS